MKQCLLFLTMLTAFTVSPQAVDSLPKLSNVLTLNEYLGYVKRFHPVAKQAQLEVNMAQANLMTARGAFDPKIEVDYDRKKFKSSEYFDILNANFKIPTWFGIELKAGFEQNQGQFLNPQNNVPEEGLYSAGIGIPLGQGLFINERMATLKQARIFTQLSQAERDLQVNEILFQASITYFEWFKAYNELQLFRDFLNNATIRFNGIRQQVIQGDIAAIDSVEAGILVNSRKLNAEQARISYVKNSLQLANFLWIENNIPLELQENVVPDDFLLDNIDETLRINNALPPDFDLNQHPKVRALQLKIDALRVDRNLKADRLKPQLDLNYNFLTSDAENVNTINSGDYKVGVRFSVPLFMRKERGSLKLAEFKIQDASLDFDLEYLQLKNKIDAGFQEINSFDDQLSLTDTIVNDYEQLLRAEERKFSFGESSIFLLNTRENSLIDSRLKQIETFTKFFSAKAQLFRTLATDLTEQ